MGRQPIWSSEVYGWIWRTLPGALPGKLLGSLILLTLAVLLLFAVVFPAVEPLLPFSDVTVDQAPVDG
ncbi:hypothetical protein BH24ACT10_BH24ACT10_09650 [soil metagenome]